MLGKRKFAYSHNNAMCVFFRKIFSQQQTRKNCVRQGAGSCNAVSRDFNGLRDHIDSGTVIFSIVKIFLSTSLTHRQRYILAALRSLSSQLTRQEL